MIPIRDEKRSLTSPHITRILILINVIVFFAYWLPDFLGYTYSNLQIVAETYGLIPDSIINGGSLTVYSTFITSMFLHGDLLHLGGNMLFLYIFGDNVEDAFGHARYLLFYLVAGVLASLTHIVSLIYFNDVTGLALPTIGASGAISGVLGAYLLLYPGARILALVFLGFVYIVPIPAVVFLGIWFVLQFLYGALAPLSGGIAYWAHIGGFIVGAFFGAAWRGRRRRREF